MLTVLRTLGKWGECQEHNGKDLGLKWRRETPFQEKEEQKIGMRADA